MNCSDKLYSAVIHVNYFDEFEREEIGEFLVIRVCGMEDGFMVGGKKLDVLLNLNLLFLICKRIKLDE